jgi:hypothetical protein
MILVCDVLLMFVCLKINSFDEVKVFGDSTQTDDMGQWPE